MTDNENNKDVVEEVEADAEVKTEAEAEADKAEQEEEPYEWTEPPIFDIEEKEDCVVAVKVTIPVVNVRDALDEVYEEVNDGVQVPGFRRGKAPRKLLEKRLGKQARSTVVQRLADAAAKVLVKEKNIKPISKVEIEGLENSENLDESKDLIYTLQFETSGTCELADYTQFVLERPDFEVNEKDVDDAIEAMRPRFGRYEPLTEGGAQDGDQVIIDFVGTVDGAPFEGNSAENYPYILGAKRFHEDMEAAMRGAKAGEDVEAEVRFADDHQTAALAGKIALFNIKINEIKRRVLPEVNDDLSKKAGFDTVAELREQIKKRIADNAGHQFTEMLREQANNKLVEESKFILPKGQTQRFVDAEYEGLTERLVREHVSAEEIEQEEETIRAAAERQGLFSIKTMYAVNEVSKKENIDVSEEDLEHYARSVSGGDEKTYELMKEFLDREDMRNASVYQILTDKVLDAVVAKASIKLIPFAPDEDAESADEGQTNAGDAQDA